MSYASTRHPFIPRAERDRPCEKMEWEKAIEHDLTAPAEARNRVYIRTFEGGSSYFRAVDRFRTTSKSRTPAATETFREPDPSLIGIETS